MPKEVHCPVCDVVVTHDRHRFTDDTRVGPGPTKIAEQYCDEHCPRCSHD